MVLRDKYVMVDKKAHNSHTGKLGLQKWNKNAKYIPMVLLRYER